MQTNKITLMDGLKHPKYSWPKTLVSYPVILDAGKEQLDSAYLLDKDQNRIPAQFTDIHEMPDGRIEAKVHFITDLPSSNERTFFIKAGKIPSNLEQDILKANDSMEEVIVLSNEEISLYLNKNFKGEEPGKYHVLCIKSSKDAIEGNVYLSTGKVISSYSVNIPHHGNVFAEGIIFIQFTDHSSIKLQIRIMEGIEFIEIQEDMEGFLEEDTAKLLIEWGNFSPDRRYTKYRDIEKIDQYNQGELLPFKLLPYSNWVNWWKTKAVAFTDTSKGKSIGIFVRDVEQWSDKKFALWDSPEALSISFRYKTMQNSDGRLIWEYPLVNGSRCTAVALYNCAKNGGLEQKSYIDDLWFWYEFLNLNKVKDWILRWDEDKSAYPHFFPEDSMPEPGVEVWHYGVRKEAFSPAFMEDIIYHLSHNMNQLHSAGAVSCREFFSWVYVFDMAAPKMTQQQFDDCKACCAFMAYASMDENFMPTGNMLAGHPNFLADVRSVPALMASLFPMHPHGKTWINQFEKAMALNLKYHVRPEVTAWQSNSGRWTENLGCYNFASLIPMMKTAALVYKAFGDNVLMYPNMVKWTEWMINALTAPVNGKRAYPPQGAHSGHYLDPLIPTSSLRFLSDRLFKYSPMLSEYLMYLCKPDAPSFEERLPNSDIYKCLIDGNLKENCGTRPKLESGKYTGYGYILRSSVGEESEVSVHLQQIDEGPNYRWGRAGQGGCGVIYYNAAGSRYSYNRPEDVGDANMGDVQNCCNFGVLIGHEYRSVGRNDLTEPMYDFGFAQYAQINAGEYSQPFYTSRSVILSGNDYIAVYDQVGDMRVRGRFAWFVKESEKFPQIAQLKPGVQGVQVNPGYPIEETGNRPIINNTHSKGFQFDGYGDFLTVVTHRSLNCDYNTYTKKTDYGAEIRLQGRTDRIFRDGSLISQVDELTSFYGYAGIIRLYGKSKAQAALFKGTQIGALGVEVYIIQKTEDNGATAGISFTIENGRLSGKAICSKSVEVKIKYLKTMDHGKFKLYLDGIEHEITNMDGDSFTFTVPQGAHTWEWTDGYPVPLATEIISTVVMSEGVEVVWKESSGAEGYSIEISSDCSKTWSTALDGVRETSCKLTGFENGMKIHLRLRGFNKLSHGEWSHDYPVYITNKVPDAPEGLKVWKTGSIVKIVWGWQLGVNCYKLYKRKKNNESFTLVYDGPHCEYTETEIDSDTIYEYTVSAVNGNGESVTALPRDTAPEGLAFWDPQPDIVFRRYTRSHEYGFNGFDPWGNAVKGELTYPNR